MSILTDAEIAAAIRGAPPEQQAGQTMIIAQHAKTLKAVEDDAQTWARSLCKVEWHHRPTEPVPRRMCRPCQTELMTALADRHFPWDNNNEVKG